MSTTTRWLFASNTFRSATNNGGFAKAGKLGAYTYNQLNAQVAANPGLLPLLNFYKPLNAAYADAYAAFLLAGGVQEGATLGLQQLEDDINHDVNAWEYTVLGIFGAATPGYKTIFPDGITGLKRGTRTERTARLKALSDALALTSALAPVKALVDARISQLGNTAGAQSGKMGATKAQSDAVEAARITLCDGLYYILGSLIAIFYKTPEHIKMFFDLQTLQAKQQTIFTGTLAAGAQHDVADRSWQPTDTLVLKATGGARIRYCLAHAAGAPYDAALPGITVGPGETLTVTAAELGDAGDAHFLIAYNVDTLNGSWEADA